MFATGIKIAEEPLRSRFDTGLSNGLGAASPASNPAVAPSASPASTLGTAPSASPASTLGTAPSASPASTLTPVPLLLPPTGAYLATPGSAATPAATQTAEAGAAPILSPAATASSPSPALTPAPAQAANGVWQQNGLLVEVKFSQISDTGFRLSFKITNEGANDLVATYNAEDFSAVDDTGTTYPPYNPAPPRTLTIVAQNSAEEYVSFDGALNPRAKQLTVTSAGLAGNQNISLVLPIGSDVADVKTAARFDQVSNQGFGLSFTMTNGGSSDFVAKVPARGLQRRGRRRADLHFRQPLGCEDVLDREQQLRQRRPFLRGRSQSPGQATDADAGAALRRRGHHAHGSHWQRRGGRQDRGPIRPGLEPGIRVELHDDQ